MDLGSSIEPKLLLVEPAQLVFLLSFVAAWDRIALGAGIYGICLFVWAAADRTIVPQDWQLDDQIAGCTGYVEQLQRTDQL